MSKRSVALLALVTLIVGWHAPTNTTRVDLKVVHRIKARGVRERQGHGSPLLAHRRQRAAPDQLARFPQRRRLGGQSVEVVGRDQSAPREVGLVRARLVADALLDQPGQAGVRAAARRAQGVVGRHQWASSPPTSRSRRCSTRATSRCATAIPLLTAHIKKYIDDHKGKLHGKIVAPVRGARVRAGQGAGDHALRRSEAVAARGRARGRTVGGDRMADPG